MAIDEPVSLDVLVDEDVLCEVLDSCTKLDEAAVAVVDTKGRRLAQRGTPSASGPLIQRDLVYSGERLGTIDVGPVAEENRARAERLAEHLVGILGVVIHASYARHLTSTVHEAAVEEAFAEVADKNKRLSGALDRLQELDRLKSSFLSTVSHELRTPLTSIIGYSEMILEGLAGDVTDDQREYLETILGKADHLLQLITGMLDVSLLESKSLKLECAPVSILEVIEAVAATLAKDAERRKVVVQLPTQPVPRVNGDIRKLRQVVLHLLANAIKFSPEGGDVIVGAAVGPLSPDDTSTFGSPTWHGRLGERFGVRLSVSDSGIGIDDEKKVAIFDPFFQIDQSSTREYGGSGLGLSLAKSYVEAHGGFIWVESNPTAGSTFTVSLPAVSADLEAFVNESPSQPTVKSSG